MTHSTSLLFALVLSTGPFSCSDRADITAEDLRTASDTVVEEHDIGTLTWNVDDEGRVTLLVEKTPGTPDPDAKGFVSVGEGDDRIAVVLQKDEAGVLRAKLPELEDDQLNHVTYVMMSEGKAVEGALHLGEGGTAALAAARKGTKDKPGPNGGAVQVLGEDVVEVVADRGSDLVRVYVLDSNNKPIAHEDREVTLALDGKKMEVIRLEPVEGELYLQGSFSEEVAPQKLTVSVRHHGRHHVAVVGWSASSTIRLGKKGTHLYFFVERGWKTEHHATVDVHDHQKHHKHKKHKKHHDHQDVKVRSREGSTRVDVKVK